MNAAEQKLAVNPADGRAAAAFAQASLRRARVESNGGYTLKAERVLKAVLDREPGDYDALKMLGAVYMSQHRFREAINIATRATRVHPNDAWNYGVLGDAHVELGEYDAAFDAFDTMARHRPDAAAYARIAYAQELQGHLDAAIARMRMASEATGAQDPESLAWHYAVDNSAIQFLLNAQLTDGGWPAFQGDSEASWTTALALCTLTALNETSDASSPLRSS